METVYLGSFKEIKMIGARATKIVAERCQNNLKMLKFAPPKRGGDEPIFKFERPSHFCLGDQPLEVDPYEKRTVYVKDLEQFPGEQGLFAKRDIAAGEQVAYYSGVVYDDREQPTFSANMTDDDV